MTTMLSPPRGHVRQRSVGKIETNERDVQAAEPLLEGKEVDHPPPPRMKSDRKAIIALWVLSVVLSSLVTYLLVRPQVNESVGSLQTGYDTELGKLTHRSHCEAKMTAD